MKTYTKFLIGATITLSSLIGLEHFGPTKKGCEIYQGFGADPINGEMGYVFDPMPKGREDNARYSILGDPILKDSLIKGKNYCFTYTQPVLGENKQLRDIHPNNPSSLEARTN